MATTDIVVEVIAHLDTFERDLELMKARVREYRHQLFESLDTEDDEVLD